MENGLGICAPLESDTVSFLMLAGFGIIDWVFSGITAGMFLYKLSKVTNILFYKTCTHTHIQNILFFRISKKHNAPKIWKKNNTIRIFQT